MGATIALTITANDDGSSVIQNFSVNAVKAFRQAEAASNDAVQKIRNGWSSLKGAWVEVAASIYTLKKAWDIADMAGQFLEQKDSLQALASEYGESADAMINKIQEVSKGLISMATAASVSAHALAKGLTPDQIYKIAGAAELLSNVTGKQVSESFRTLAEAIALGKQKGLEAELGIIDLKAEYGDLVEKMSEAERAQKTYAIVMEKVDTLHKRLGEGTTSAGDRMEWFTRLIEDLTVKLGVGLLRVGAGVVAVFLSVAAAALTIAGALTRLFQYVSSVQHALAGTPETKEMYRNRVAQFKLEADALKNAAGELNSDAVTAWEILFKGIEEAPVKGLAGRGKGVPDPVTDAIVDLWETRFEFVEGQIKAKPLGLEAGYFDGGFKLSPSSMKAADKFWDDWIDSIDAVTIANEQFFAQTGEMSLDYYNHRVSQITDEVAYWVAAGVSEVAVRAWANAEILKLEEQRWSKEKKAEEDKQKSFTAGMQDYQAALSAISSGSLSQIAGLFGPIGQMIGGVIELITNIGSLPDLLKGSIAGLVQGARDFGKAIVEIIKEIVPQLPAILTEIIVSLVDSVDEIITALIEALPEFITALVKAIPVIITAIINEVPQIIKALVEGIPEMVIALVEGLWDAIVFIFTGGTLESAISDWTEETSVTVELDTTEAMNALMYAQDALLGALNDTDRAVAREALLSAREAAILAEEASTSDTSTAVDDLSTSFKGLFDILGDFFTGIWDSIAGFFSDIGDSVWGFFRDLWRSIAGFFSDIGDSVWGFFTDIWDSITGFFSDLGDSIWGFFTDIWDSITGFFDDFWDSITGGEGGWADDWFGYGDSWSFHQGGAIKKAHSGLYIGSGLGSQEVPIIAKVGEGVLNDYNGMSAIGGEAGLNYANAHGSLPGGASQTFVTQHQYFKVVVDKDGNTIKLTKTQAKNLARTLGPALTEMQRDGELALA